MQTKQTNTHIHSCVDTSRQIIHQPPVTSPPLPSPHTQFGKSSGILASIIRGTYRETNICSGIWKWKTQREPNLTTIIDNFSSYTKHTKCDATALTQRDKQKLPMHYIAHNITTDQFDRNELLHFDYIYIYRNNSWTRKLFICKVHMNDRQDIKNRSKPSDNPYKYQITL